MSPTPPTSSFPFVHYTSAAAVLEPQLIFKSGYLIDYSLSPKLSASKSSLG